MAILKPKKVRSTMGNKTGLFYTGIFYTVYGDAQYTRYIDTCIVHCADSKENFQMFLNNLFWNVQSN